MYTLSIIRLSPIEHSYMAELNVTVKGVTYALCSDDPLAEAVPEFDESGDPLGSYGAPPPCRVEPMMWLNVSYATENVFLHPSLLFPDIQVCRRQSPFACAGTAKQGQIWCRQQAAACQL